VALVRSSSYAETNEWSHNVLPPYAFMEQTGTTLVIYRFLLYSYFVSTVKEITQPMLNTSSALEKKI